MGQTTRRTKNRAQAKAKQVRESARVLGNRHVMTEESHSLAGAFSDTVNKLRSAMLKARADALEAGVDIEQGPVDVRMHFKAVKFSGKNIFIRNTQDETTTELELTTRVLPPEVYKDESQG